MIYFTVFVLTITLLIESWYTKQLNKEIQDLKLELLELHCDHDSLVKDFLREKEGDNI